MRVSVIIRTLDEEQHLQALLEGIGEQRSPSGLEGDFEVEVVVVDSGSLDRTLEIADAYDCRVVHITREEFSFGRSLNLGCDHSRGDVLVFVSGHCVPCSADWLARLIEPIARGEVESTYGAQRPGPATRFSEARLFARQYPAHSEVPQEGIFCNNANAALRRDVWEKFRFDELCTGLEDMELGKRIVAAGHRIGYVAEAAVYHHHDETLREVGWRFEREALALQAIMPEVHLRPFDFVRYFASAVGLDLRAAHQQGGLLSQGAGIVAFRWQQYLGSYRGNRGQRRLSRRNKDHYFYPRRLTAACDARRPGQGRSAST